MRVVFEVSVRLYNGRLPLWGHVQRHTCEFLLEFPHPKKVYDPRSLGGGLAEELTSNGEAAISTRLFCEEKKHRLILKPLLPKIKAILVK